MHPSDTDVTAATRRAAATAVRLTPRLTLPALLSLLTLVSTGTLAAAPLPADPTRPPGSAATRFDDPARAPRPATAAVAVRPPPIPRPAPLPNLQAVMQPQHGPASALLDGQWLRAGDGLVAWQVEAIRADGLLLRPLPAAQRPSREPVWLPLVAPLDRHPSPPAPPAPTGPDTARTARSDAPKEP